MTLQSDSSKALLQQRLNWLYLPVVLIFALLAARLWQLQILEGAEYSLKAERNRIRNIQVVAPRGTIFDRNRNALVENRSGFNILLYRESTKDLEATQRFIVERLGVPLEDLSARLRKSKSTGLYRPVVIKEDVGIDDISVVEAHKREHPEIQLGPEPRRFYRYGSLAAHVLGYVGEVSEDELARGAFPGLRSGDLVGKSGVERIYNQQLTGVDGRRQVLVDSLGREVGLVDEVDSTVGGDLRITLDLDLQMVAEKLLEGKVGTIMAMNPRNGEILVMASAPSFDPNNFSTRISEQEWNGLINDPNRPLQNRAIQNNYSPGSVFKLIMAVAGLQEGLVDDTTRVLCTGSRVFYNRVFHCHQEKGHGNVDLDRALTKSCNIFFYELGRKMGISKIAQHAQELGFGERTGVDLPSERSGLIPTPEWKQQVRGSKWFAGETISVSIGQGAVSMTPLQLLRAVSAIANDGRLPTPHVSYRADHEKSEISHQWVNHEPSLGTGIFKQIRDGMWAAVNNGGTGYNAALAGLDVCGKTGTVQVIGNERKKEIKTDGAQIGDHAWFVGFASRDNPEIAVAVLLEHGGKGGVAAAPLARQIFQAFYGKKQQPMKSDPQLTRQIAEVRP